MREIKFRGISEENDGWVYGDLIHCGNNNEKRQIMSFDDPSDPTFELCVENVIPSTVGQFTGLLDRNGKKIYEGDVMMNKNAKVFVIVYRGGGFCAMSPREYCLDLAGDPVTISDPLGAKQSSDYFQEQCWVIGNVHERSELLDVAEG